MPVSDQGKLANRYKLVPRTLIFITCGKGVLLLKGASTKKLWANRYNGIGGHIERGEGVISAALRELSEETGLTGCHLRLCGVATIDTGPEAGICIFILRGDLPTREALCSSDGDLKWVEQNQVYELPLVEDLHLILPKVLKSSPNSLPFSAHYCYDLDGKLIVKFDEPDEGEEKS